MGNISAEQIQWIMIGVLTLIVSTAFHEFGHAFVADWLGDDTPRRQGRVTLNPLVHIDPIGTLLLPLVGGLYGAAAGGRGGGFGWGKPVQWQPSRIRRGISMSTASILVSIAGPGMNLVLALLVTLAQVLLVGHHVIAPDAHIAYMMGTAMEPDKLGMACQILSFIVLTNFILMFFNLVPAPPLDGGHVLGALVPYKHRGTYESYARFGPFVLMAVAMIPVLSQIFQVPARFCAEHLYKALAAIFGG